MIVATMTANLVMIGPTIARTTLEAVTNSLTVVRTARNAAMIGLRSVEL